MYYVQIRQVNLQNSDRKYVSCNKKKILGMKNFINVNKLQTSNKKTS